jgi:hypothetical protein
MEGRGRQPEPKTSSAQFWKKLGIVHWRPVLPQQEPLSFAEQLTESDGKL